MRTTAFRQLEVLPVVRRHPGPSAGAKATGLRRLAATTPGERAVTVAAIVATVHYVALSAYTVDDAAISYAYASALADGLPPGVVTAGEPIAEGYSNPTWTVLLAVAVRLGVSPATAATVLGGVLCAAGAVLATLLIARLVQHRHLAYVGALAGCSVTWVLWAASGLENALFGVLVLGTTMALTTVLDRPGLRPVAGAGILLALVGLSRPEGFVYVLAGLVVLLAGTGVSRRRRAGSAAGVGLVVGLVVVPYLIWHHARFGVLMANPVYAKGASSITDSIVDGALDPTSPGWSYVSGFLTDHLWVLLVPAVVVAASRWRTAVWPVLVMAATTLALPILEPDWMVGYRFASTTALLLVVLAAVGIDTARSSDAFRGRAAVALTALLVVAGVANLAIGAGIATSGLAGAVTVANVEARSDRMAALGVELGLDDPLVMLPDIGAALERTDLRILDSAGLADVQIAHSWSDTDARWQYAFEERRPALVHTHASWSRAWAIAEPADVERAGYATLSWDQENLDGDFVRRDTVIVAGLDLGRPLVVAAAPVIGREILVDAYWTEPPGPSSQQVRLLAGGVTVAETTTPLGYGIADLARWQDGETLRQHTRLPIPADAPPGPYEVVVRAGAEVVTIPVPEAGGGADPAIARALAAFPDTLVTRLLERPTPDRAVVRGALDAGACDMVLAASYDVSAARGRSRPTAEDRALATAATDQGRDDRPGYDCLLAASILDPERSDLLLALVERRSAAVEAAH